MSKIQDVSVCIVLDRSGSMASRETSARKAVNDYVTGLATDAATADAIVSLLIFDSVGIDVIRDRVAASAWREVSADEYSARGGTPLYDAVARGVILLDSEPTDRRRLPVVVTDGYENASQEHTARSIKALLEDRQRRGWSVLNLGADHDAWSQAESIGFRAESVAEFRGFGQAASVLQQQTVSFACSCDAGFTAAQRAQLQEGDNGTS